jgi:E3 ubiquitin-protein ligase SHPRH
MIEQNQTNIRVEERTLVAASLQRAHVLGNNEEDIRRSEKALAIYESVLESCMEIVRSAREQLGAALANVDSTDDDPGNDGEELSLGRLRNNLRIGLQLLHASTFYAATSYYQIKSNEALTLEGSDDFKRLEEKEASLYEDAKLLRKEILSDTASRAETLMLKIQKLAESNTMTKIPTIKDLQSLGGIESRRIVEKSDELFNVIREQNELLKDWRSKMAALLVKPLVDKDEEKDMVGDEYEDSTKQQDELYVYFDAFKAVHSDLIALVTGESAPLIDHEAKVYLKNCKWFLDPEFAEDDKPHVHAPELGMKLFTTRKRLRDQRDRVGSVRGLIQEARTLEGSMHSNEPGSRSGTEYAIVRRHLQALQSMFSSYTKALGGLEKEVELFRSTQNQRVEFYRQLQELSDDVAPYKEELDKQLDQPALNVALQKEKQSTKTLAQLKTKNRFLLHLRDESGTQAGPKVCIICTSTFEQGVLTVCGHQFCKECIQQWFLQARTCPMCKRHLTSADLHNITFRPQLLRAQEEHQSGGPSVSPSKSSSSPSNDPPHPTGIYSDVSPTLLEEIKSIDLPNSYGTKIDTLGRHLHWIREHDPGAKSIVFSQYREFLDVLGIALRDFKLGHARLGRSGAAEKFKHDPSIDCLLLDAKTDSSGLTLVNATHVFICEPLIQTAVELQAIARVHRIGQTRPTMVWMYLINDTVEEAIYEISVQRRLAHVQSRDRSKKTSREATPGALQEKAIEVANSEELQSAALSTLLTAGKTGGEVVGSGDLWKCLFGKTTANNSAAAQGEVGRFLRAEAAEERRSENESDGPRAGPLL